MEDSMTLQLAPTRDTGLKALSSSTPAPTRFPLRPTRHMTT